jgi:hypothetical protein
VKEEERRERCPSPDAWKITEELVFPFGWEKVMLVKEERERERERVSEVGDDGLCILFFGVLTEGRNEEQRGLCPNVTEGGVCLDDVALCDSDERVGENTSGDTQVLYFSLPRQATEEDERKRRGDGDVCKEDFG